MNIPVKTLLTVVVMVMAIGSGVRAEDAAPKNGDTLSLDRCVEIAIANHPDIAGGKAVVTQKEAQVGQAFSGYLPSVDVSGQYNKYESNYKNASDYYSSISDREQYTNTVTLKETLYDFGKRSSQNEAAKLGLDSSRVDVDDLAVTVAINVKSAYYELLRAERSLKLQKEILNTYQQYLKLSNEYYQAGTKSKYDVSKFNVDVTKSILEFTKAQNAVRTARAALNNYMGVPVDRKYDVQDNLHFTQFDVKYDEAIQKAQEKKPELVSLVTQLKAARETVDIEKNAYYPTLTGTAMYGWDGSQQPWSNGWNANVGVTMNVFNGFYTNNKVKEAVAKVAQLQSKIDSIRLRIEGDIRKAYINMEQAVESVRSASTQINQAKESLELAKVRYSSGISSVTEISEATVTYNTAELAYISALYDHKVAQITIEKSMGIR